MNKFVKLFKDLKTKLFKKDKVIEENNVVDIDISEVKFKRRKSILPYFIISRSSKLKNAFAYEMVYGAADDYHIQDLYNKITKTLMWDLNGIEFAINVCDNRINIFIVNDPYHKNEPKELMDALENFFRN